MANLVKICFAELHSPLFLGKFSSENRPPEGKNLGVKLYKKSEKGVFDLTYDRDNKELIVKQGDLEAIVPLTNVSAMWPDKDYGEAAVSPSLVNQHKSVGRPPKNAQVSTPHDHVFEGTGSGKTRD